MICVQNKFGYELSEPMTSGIKKRMGNLLENEIFLGYLEGATLLKEQSLSFKGELKKVDLILEYGDRNVVIDYKSSKKFHIKDKKQVGVYQKAIEKITQKSTKGVIVYLLEDEVEFFEV